MPNRARHRGRHRGSSRTTGMTRDVFASHSAKPVHPHHQLPHASDFINQDLAVRRIGHRARSRTHVPTAAVCQARKRRCRPDLLPVRSLRRRRCHRGWSPAVRRPPPRAATGRVDAQHRPLTESWSDPAGTHRSRGGRRAGSPIGSAGSRCAPAGGSCEQDRGARSALARTAWGSPPVPCRAGPTPGTGRRDRPSEVNTMLTTSSARASLSSSTPRTSSAHAVVIAAGVLPSSRVAPRTARTRGHRSASTRPDIASVNDDPSGRSSAIRAPRTSLPSCSTATMRTRPRPDPTRT